MPVDSEKHTIDILYSCLLAFYISLFILPNVIGVTRYVDLSFTLLNMHIPMHMSLGGVAFPITFFISQYISLRYGQKIVYSLIWIGIAVNAAMMLLMFLGGLLPKYEHTASACPNLYRQIEWLAFAGISSSLTAFALSAFSNIQLFHVCIKTLGQGQTGIASFLATAVSQFIDTTVIYLMLFLTQAIPIHPDQNIPYQLAIYIFTGYTYKFLWSIGGSGLIHAMRKKPA